jgi:hypothetical protein
VPFAGNEGAMIVQPRAGLTMPPADSDAAGVDSGDTEGSGDSGGGDGGDQEN